LTLSISSTNKIHQEKFTVKYSDIFYCFTCDQLQRFKSRDKRYFKSLGKLTLERKIFSQRPPIIAFNFQDFSFLKVKKIKSDLKDLSNLTVNFINFDFLNILEQKNKK